MQFLLDALVNGVILGSQYALIAAGLALIFGVAGIVNFAQGELYMVGAYALYVGQASLGLPYWLAAIGSVVFMMVFGVGFYTAIVRPVAKAGWQKQLVATLAASVLFVNLAIVLAGSLPKVVHSPLVDNVVAIGSVRFSQQRILVVVCTLLSFLALYVMLKHTKWGKAMRALAQNQSACAVVGIPVHRAGLLAVVIGCALAGVAGATIPLLSNVTPTMGLLLTIKAFAAVIMGGFGNVTGAIVSAFALGIAEALAMGYISTAYADVFVFGVLILVLLLRPHGLFGRAVRVA
jgi:branched-chain amino acid transport system permease protein